MAYDSRTDRYNPLADSDSATPWHGTYAGKDWREGVLNRTVKRQTKRKARRIRKDCTADLPRWTQTYGKRVFCRCCCTAQC